MLRARCTLAVAVIAACFGLTGCDENGIGPNNPSVSSSITIVITPPAALPGRLPEITTQESVEPTLRELIRLGITNAVGVDSQDRNPKIIVTSDFACGIKIKATACMSDIPNPNSEIVIYINPTLTWSQFQQPAGRGGGNAVVQNATLGAVVQYLTYRDIQRQNPQLMISSSDAAIAEAKQTLACKNGEVYGGLHGIMPPEVARNWQKHSTSEYKELFARGYRGEC